MTVVVSAAFLFTVLMVITVWRDAHKLWHALVAFLAGFFIATTAAAPVIRSVLDSIARAFGHH